MRLAVRVCPMKDGLDYAAAVQQLRLQRGLSRHELAERSGVSYSYLCEVERGAKRPSADVLAKLAEALGMKPSELVSFAEATAVASMPPPATKPVVGVKPDVAEYVSGPGFPLEDTDQHFAQWEKPWSRKPGPYLVRPPARSGVPRADKFRNLPRVFQHWVYSPKAPSPEEFETILQLWSELRSRLRYVHPEMARLLDAIGELEPADVHTLLQLAERLARGNK